MKTKKAIINYLSLDSIMRFVNIWLFLSLFFIVLSYMLAEAYPPSFHINLMIKTFEAIGIAIFVGNIFTFVLGTEQFVDYIRDRVLSLMTSKEFISKLPKEEKRNILAHVLLPSADVSKVDSRITDYYYKHIDKSLEISEIGFRKSMKVDIEVTFDKELNKIIATWEIEHTSYRIDGPHRDEILYCDTDEFKILETRIYSPNGDNCYRVDEEGNEFNPYSDKNDPTLKKQSKASLPTEFEKYKYITMYRKIVNHERDHWANLALKLEIPTHGLEFSVRCHDGIEIREVNVFSGSEAFDIYNEESITKRKISCKGWLNEGTGLHVIVAKPHASAKLERVA